jgi:hypothetical protein
MDFIRKRFHMLEFSVFVCWGIALGLLVAILIALFAWPGFNQIAGVFGAAMLIGPLIASFLWFGWRVMLRGLVWSQYKSTFDKVFYGACTLGIQPLCLLLLDLNAKHVVRRFYTGSEPIQYTFLRPVERTVPAVGALES